MESENYIETGRRSGGTKGLDRLPQTETEAPERYLSCVCVGGGGCQWELWSLIPKQAPPEESTRTEKGIHIISGCEKQWVGVCQEDKAGNSSTLLKGQHIKFPVEPLTLCSSRHLSFLYWVIPSCCGGYLPHADNCYTGGFTLGEDSWPTLLENTLPHGAEFLRPIKRLRLTISH